MPGQHIWISVHGDDNNSGDSISQALRTLRSALCRVQPGQTVHLLPGLYHEAVALGGAGGPNSDTILIRGEGTEPSQVVLDREFWRSFAISLVESYPIPIGNLTVQHYTDEGIYSLSGGSVSLVGVLSRENGRCSVDPDAEGEGFGVNLDGTADILVEASRFEYNGPLLAPDNYWDGGIWIDESVDVTVRSNRFRNNWGGAGMQISDEEGAYPLTSKRITVTANTLTDHFAGIMIWGYGICPPPSDVISFDKKQFIC